MFRELEKAIYKLYNVKNYKQYEKYRDDRFRFNLKRTELLEKYDTGKICNRCKNILIPSILKDFDYQCLYCEEDYCKSEKMVINKEF